MADKGELWSYHQGRWNATKLALRCLSFVLSIVIIGLSANQGVRVSNLSEDHWGFYINWYFTLPITLISIGTDGTELMFSFLWKRNPGLHPGWHIGIELALLGGNIVALIFISTTIPGDYTYYYFPDFPRDLGHIIIATVAFLGIFTVNRFILFVIACVDTHRYHTAAQVQLIVQTLRQQNLNDPTTAAIIHNSMYPTNNSKPVPLQDLPQAVRPSDEATLYPELPENQKFLGDLRSFKMK
ncbi:hypothetical protein F5Y10DRAFT_117242 [Nemania abortiva]|nr:hypothetical protein F5Y10DRAFT_117242 [Nemania abortiva]